jgi:8-oxo-dGTP diphosphatase
MIEVAAGVLTDARGRVLLMQRLPGTHLAGTWEFPGGKLEAGEDIEAGLKRELREELDIDAHGFGPLISLPWRYPEKDIRLHALHVNGWTGEPRAREGHPLRWVPVEGIDPAEMPAADRPIVAALRLPPQYIITPGNPDLHAGARLRATGALLQVRSPGSDRADVRACASDLLARAPELKTRLLINADVELARELGVGVHLRAAQLGGFQQRPLPDTRWVGASCHDADELERAAMIGVDFATLSPVCATRSHPDAVPLGWQRFAELVHEARLPVYALGGVGPDDLERARAAGAQGVAGIRAFLG